MDVKRRTKIVCTIGPACESAERFTQMANAGMDIARINFSHQEHNDHLKRVAVIKQVRDELKLPIAILGDTKGPEVRIGKVKNNAVTLTTGQDYILTTEDILADDSRASITHKDLPSDIRVGARILIDDGLIELIAEAISGNEIHCKVLNGGLLKNQKGVNVPGVRLSLPFISSRDRNDLLFAVKNGFDFIATSFTRTAKDVLSIRAELDRLGARDMRLIAKIENAEGVANINEILDVADGIMVARGDMGVEIPLEEIPAIQKRLIKTAVEAGKPVITATQMLESMTKNPRPTRAEATDVANAIYDGTSAIMLSGETAAGDYPIETVKTMARIATRAERDIDYKAKFSAYRLPDDQINITNAVSRATCSAAHVLNATCIVTVTKSGETARMISRFRPACPIIGCSPSDVALRQLNLSWGVTPVKIEEQTNSDILFAHSIEEIQKSGQANDGDLVVITAGMPLGVPGQTNMMKIHVVGERLT